MGNSDYGTVPVSAYVGSSKNLNDRKGIIRIQHREKTDNESLKPKLRAQQEKARERLLLWARDTPSRGRPAHERPTHVGLIARVHSLSLSLSRSLARSLARSLSFSFPFSLKPHRSRAIRLTHFISH